MQRPSSHTDGARNAAQAIEHGVADAWQELPDLRTV